MALRPFLFHNCLGLEMPSNLEDRAAAIYLGIFPEYKCKMLYVYIGSHT